jgi:hypothetical protein
VIQSCFFHDVASTARYAVLLPSNAVFLNNTVVTNLGAAAYAAVYISWGSDWSKATVVRNNVIVNHGKGSAIRFDYSSSQGLGNCAADYNCYYAPKSARPILVGSYNYPFFGGSLASFLLWQKAGKHVRPGGPAMYDSNSIEGDPGLISLQAPYDIHLKKTSPLVDRGTAEFVPRYVYYGWSVNLDIDGDARLAPIDIGADEIAISLTGRGSGQVGTVMELIVAAQFDAGLPYQLATSFGDGPILIGTRKLGLDFDPIMFASVMGFIPSIFQNYSGILDKRGQAKARLVIPDNGSLRFLTFYSAFVTIRPGAPENIGTISNTFSFRIP